MISSVEMALWAIHHATTLLFGVFASAALCGIEINRRHALELVGVGAATGAAFSIANVVGGELFARQVYPLVVHLPLTVYLCARYRLSPLLAALGVTSAYLSCQFSNWMGIAAFAATDSQIAYYLARIATTLGVFAVLLHWAGDIGPRLAIKSPTELGILLILPLVYYIFDYATNVYTTLFHSGSVVTVEFLAFALCAFYLMFLAVYLREYEEKETAERERWMLETRDSAAIKELEAWRQSGRELSILRHDMRHFLRGLATLIEEGHTDEALKRIDELCEAGDRTAVRRFCANETVNIALSSFNSDINRNGITANLRAAPSTWAMSIYSVWYRTPWTMPSPRRAPPPKASGLSTWTFATKTVSFYCWFPTRLAVRRTWSTACPWLSTLGTALAPRALNLPSSA